MHRLAPLAAALALALPAAAQVRFHVTAIGTLGGTTSRAQAIADDGTVVGQSSLLTGSASRAFSFRDGLLVDLDPQADPLVSSAAHAVREQGRVGGSLGRDAALFAARQVTALGNLGGPTRVTGIDAQGRVYGRGEDSTGRTRAFRQIGNGSLQILFDYGQGGAEAVTPDGTAYGWVRDSFGFLMPARWTGGVLQLLELPTGPGYVGQVFAVNAQGVAVGRRDDGLGLQPGAHATVWRQPMLAQTIPGDLFDPLYNHVSVALGVNDAVQVVGRAETRLPGLPEPLSSAGWIWAGGARHALDELLQGDPGVSVAEATGINRWGQIAANGTDGRALLLTPTGTLHWRGGDGDRFDDPAAWDSGDLGFAPNRFLSARLDAATPTTVQLRGDQHLQTLALGEASAPGAVRLVLDGGALLRLERLDLGAGGRLGGHGRVQGELRLRGEIETRGEERLVIDGPLQHQGRITAHERSRIVYLGDVVAAGNFGTEGEGLHRFEGRLELAEGVGTLTLGHTEIAGHLLLRLGGLRPGLDHDQLSFAGTLAFTPGAVLDLRWDQGFVAADGDRFQLFRFTGPVDGRPGELWLPDLPRGLVWRTEALLQTGVLGVAAVPEPTALVLWMAGGLALALRRRLVLGAASARRRS